MKKHLVFVVCLVALLALPIPAQMIPKLVADIPFGFHAGDTWLPAGEYRFVVINGAVRVESDQRNEVVLLVRNSGRSDPNRATFLTFTKYSADRIFLARLQYPASAQDLMKSKREREIVSSRVVSQNKPETVVILARAGR